MRTRVSGAAAALGVVVVTGVAAPGATAAPAGAKDVTAAVLAGDDVTLSGDTVVTVPAGRTTYDGVFRGRGTLTVRGSGTLVLTKDSDFTLPESRQRQRVATQGGNHPYTTVSNPDAPAITVERGATLQYGTGGGTGLIGHFPYDTPGYRLNQLNIRVDGTLRLSLVRTVNLGTISGSGLVSQPRFMWGKLDIAGTHPFSGVIDNGTAMDAGKSEYPVSLPNARAVLNQGTWTVDTPLGQTVTLRQNFYQREYGSDINVQSRPGSKVVLTGQYSWSDRGGDTNPSLSDPALNWRPARKNVNKRGTNIKGADVQWGDGTTDKIFMPGTAETVYINLLAARARSRLTFDYDGPVTLGAPIGGGRFHDTLSAPGAGDVVIKGTKGNDVTFAAVQYYDGSTTVQKGAVLRLGSGRKGGDGGLHTKGRLYKLVNDGSLILHNTAAPLVLSRIGGSGSLTQSGTATATLTGAAVTYTGTTTVTKGTLALDGTGLAHSRAIRLTGSGARLDVRGAPGATLDLATSLSGRGTVVGSVTSTGKVAGGVTVTGDYAQRAGGRLVAGGGALKVGGKVALAGRLDARAVASPDAPAPPKTEEKPKSKAGSGARTKTGAETVTLIDHVGRGRTTGAFSGLKEGATVEAGGAAYRISYRGGDGNDVVLTPATASPSASARAAGEPSGPKAAHPQNAAGRGFLSGAWWPVAAALGLLATLLVTVTKHRRRGRRQGGRHASTR
ncbi:autotransporter [Streptomyces sp. NPDC060006]|uniref:autotransporter n=1 Tax=unclassified Streptomyces TaxID=2593676 RepID=UPI0036D059B5